MKNNQQMIEDNTKLVYFLVNKYYPNLLKDEDIIQCGMVGLCNAVKNYDYTKGKFSTYAKIRILGEIKDELRSRNKRSVETSLDQLLEESANAKN